MSSNRYILISSIFYSKAALYWIQCLNWIKGLLSNVQNSVVKRSNATKRFDCNKIIVLVLNNKYNINIYIQRKLIHFYMLYKNEVWAFFARTVSGLLNTLPFPVAFRVNCGSPSSQFAIHSMASTSTSKIFSFCIFWAKSTHLLSCL